MKRTKQKNFFFLITLVAEKNGQGDHDHARAGPDVLHQELFQHDVPQALGEDKRHLVVDGFVCPVQMIQLHLQQHKKSNINMTDRT